MIEHGISRDRIGKDGLNLKNSTCRSSEVRRYRVLGLSSAACGLCGRSPMLVRVGVRTCAAKDRSSANRIQVVPCSEPHHPLQHS